MTQADQAIHEDLATSSARADAAQAILVLGMHRSGTSALARVLNLLGVELGNDLLPPAADNEMGFWEHRQIQFIHDRVYETLKSDWTNVSALPIDWQNHPGIEPYREQLRETIARDFGQQPLWGVKDPRLCAMLPLWRPLLEQMQVQPRCVLICRNPTEVSRSLAKRDHMSAARVYLLWLRSMIDSERESRGLPRTITTFDQVLGDWAGEANRISLALDLKWPRSITDVSEAVGEFLRPSVKHHQVDDGQFLDDPQIPAMVRRMYSAVLKAAASGETQELSATVDTVQEELDHGQPLLSEFIRSLEQEHRNTVIEKNIAGIQLGDQTALTESAAADAADKARQMAELGQQLQQARAKTEELSNHASALQQQLSELQAASAAATAQAADEKAELQNEILGLKHSLAVQIDLLVKHRSETDVLRVELGQYQIQRMVLLKTLEKMTATRAWRWGSALPLGSGQELTEADLIPVSPMRNLGANRWACDSPAQFAVTCLPMRGKVSVFLHLTVSVPGNAHLYFDTGHLFNSNEHVELGSVEGEISIAIEVDLKNSVHCFRLDPLDRDGEFTIHQFLIKSIGR